MLNRRDLLLSAAALSLTPVGRLLAQQAPNPVAAMNALFDRFVQEQLQRSPETATGLGLDKGDLAPLKSRLTDASLAAVAKEKADNAAPAGRRSGPIDPARQLTGSRRGLTDTGACSPLEVEDEGNRAFSRYWLLGGSGSAYIS